MVLKVQLSILIFDFDSHVLLRLSHFVSLCQIDLRVNNTVIRDQIQWVRMNIYSLLIKLLDMYLN